MKTQFIAVTVAAAFMGMQPPAAAQADYVWTSSIGGDWNVSKNWTPSGVPNARDVTAEFKLDRDKTITLEGSYTIGSLVSSFNSGSTGVTTLSGGALVLEATSGTPRLKINKGTTILSDLSGTQGFEKTGDGALLLSGNNSNLSGTVTLKDQGFIQLADGTSAGRVDFVINMAPNTGGGNTSAIKLVPSISPMPFNHNIHMMSEGVKELSFARVSGQIYEINSTVTIDAGQNFRLRDLSNNATAYLNGALKGEGGFSLINGRGLYILNMDASGFEGDFSVSGGTIKAAIARDDAFGVGNLFTPGSLKNRIFSDSDGARTLHSRIVLGGGGHFGDARDYPENTGRLIFTEGMEIAGNSSTIVVDGASMALEIQGIIEHKVSRFDDSDTLTKEGEGTLIFSGLDSDYSRNTLVSAGALLVNGSILAQAGGLGTGGTRTIEVSANATLGGVGTIENRPVTMKGALSPGDATAENTLGTLTVQSDLTWNADSTNAWVFELGAPGLSQENSGTSDRLAITGASGNFLKGGTATAFIFDFAGTGQKGWYQLVNWAGKTDFVGTEFQARNLAGGARGEFKIDGNVLYLNVIP